MKLLNWKAWVAVCGMVVSCPAQQQMVVPPDFGSKEATGSTNLPFGRSVPLRVQMAYDWALLPGDRQIQGLAFRGDGVRANAAKTVDLSVYLSTMPRPLGLLQGNFALNRGTDHVECYRRRKVALPALTADRALNSYALSLPLDKPFVYRRVQGRPLLTEFVIHSQPRGAYRLDTTYVCNSPVVPLGPKGCPRPNGKSLEVELLTERIMWGRTVMVQVRNAPPFARTMLLLGSRASGAWGDIVLPWDARPARAPGCFLSVDFHVALSLNADAGGKANYQQFVPSDPGLDNFSAVVQGLAVDRQANALGLVSSQAKRMHVCGWERVGRVFANGLHATAGYRELGLAPVLRLTVK